MILGLNGLKGSGKDTVAAYLIKEYGFERRAFADPMKKSMAAFLGVDFHMIEQWKNDLHIKIVVEDDRNPSKHIAEKNFRTGVQDYAEDGHRGVFGQNFWLDWTLPKDAFYSGRKIVVTDVRYPNEAMRIHNCDGFVVNIVRPDLTSDDSHKSEQPLENREIDFKLVNDETLDVLFLRTENMLVHLGSLVA